MGAGIADAYVEEVLPGNFGVPSTKWDFAAHTGEPQLRLRDHGNELVVGLTLLYALGVGPEVGSRGALRRRS